MAKRNPNDRNELAVQKAKRKAENLDTFTLSDGTVITLKNIDAVFLQTVMSTVEYPTKPTYDVTLASGRVEQYPMDKEVADQTPELKPLWDEYVLGTAKAAAEEMRLMTSTIILDGTTPPAGWVDLRWERRMKLVGAKLPDDLEERWVLYLRSKMSQADVINLTGKIMRRTGVPEEYIDAAEASFRDQVPSGQDEAGDLAEPDADPGAVGEEPARQVVA